MKVLFAVSNEEISQAIIKKYQKEYKEIISHKNVYYFNAILKEIQKDKSYDRIVINEDLEAFSHTQYDQIDKFIFDKLDSISDEASNMRGNDIPIILICLDRRTKSEQMLIKLFGIGIYNAILGNDRSVEEVCKLINRPRVKKEAKTYYKIDAEEVNYQAENENDVSEMEIQNILAHYKSLGKDEARYIDSFNNIAAQYNDNQLRIITRFLPLNVRAVLEEKSPKYQKIMSFHSSVSSDLKNDKKRKNAGTSEKLLKTKNNPVTTANPVVIPSSVNMTGVKKISRGRKTKNVQQPVEPQVHKQDIAQNHQPSETQIHRPVVGQAQQLKKTQVQQQIKQVPQQQSAIVESQKETNITAQQEIKNAQSSVTSTPNKMQSAEVNEQISVAKTEEVQPVKRGRGRPRKNPVPVEVTTEEQPPVKKRRGRPRKNPLPEKEVQPIDEENNTETVLPGFDDNNTETVLPGFDDNNAETVLPGFDDDNAETVLPGFDDDNAETVLPGFDDDNTETVLSGFDDDNTETVMPGFDDDNTETVMPGFDDDNTETIMPGFDDEDDTETIMPGFDNEDDTETVMPGFSNNNSNLNSEYYNQSTSKQSYYDAEQSRTSYSNTAITRRNSEYVQTVDISSLLTSDKKIVTFVGTSKNGTSFIVNNVAELLSSMGINVAILDATTNRNSYYIYTKNEEALRNIAENSIEQLAEGIANGIQVNKNLTVFTSLPDEQDSISKVDEILETLLKNYSLILIDSDFNTPIGYFKQSLETYLIQSLDILTIQPLTAFLRELKAKNILEENKLKIILNKFVKIRGINEKTIIGGMAFYNDPAMSYMTELFDRSAIKYITIPFEEDIYIKYLEGIINCDISLKGYSKPFMQILKSLGNMVYPLVSGRGAYKPPSVGENSQSSVFSPSMNETLNQMKKNY